VQCGAALHREYEENGARKMKNGEDRETKVGSSVGPEKFLSRGAMLESGVETVTCYIRRVLRGERRKAREGA